MSVGRASAPARAGQYTALAAYLLFLGFPMLWLLSTAFKRREEIALGASSLLPSSPTPASRAVSGNCSQSAHSAT